MKRIIQSSFAILVVLALSLSISCDDLEDIKKCTGCSDDSPYSAVGSDTCYATQNECEQNESGNCVICQ